MRHLFAFSIVFFVASAVAAEKRPNILLAFADDWGRIASAYARIDGPGGINDVVHTPNFDRVAREGVLFRRAFVSAPSCTPCRSALLSGQHFWRTGRASILVGAVWDGSNPSFPLLLLAASPLLAAVAPVPKEVVAEKIPGARPRNVVFILADDHRYDAMSFMGHPFARTPQMDAMARNGVHMKNALVTTSLCSPSRASIPTGLYTFRHRVIDNNRPIPPGTVYFPQYLQQAGYATAFIGKWHMGGDSDEVRPGFDRWVSFRGQGSYLPPDPDYTLNVDGKRVKQKGYDLKNDPGESKNLFYDPALKPIAAAMEKRLYAMMEELGGMEIPLNAPLGGSNNKRLESRGGAKAADFPSAFVVEKPINQNAR